MALRERGFVIKTASINSVAPPSDGFPDRELQEVSTTYYVKSGSKTAILKTLLSVLLTHPAVIWRGLREALSLAPWDLFAIGYSLLYLAEALLLGAWMKREDCTHLHVHFSGPVATVGLLTSVAWDVPYSLTVHGPDEFFNIDKFYLLRKIQRAQFVTCISHYCRSQLLRITQPAIWGKFHVCRLGVDENVFSPVPREPGPVTKLVSVGRLHPSKGQAIMLQAIHQLKQKGIAVHLDLIGGGAYREQLQQMIAELGIEAQVTLHGAMSHASTRRTLQGADIFALSSFAEGVPVALMEAMAMEIACVSTFVAGIPELIRTGEEGILVAPSSVEDLRDAIEVLVLDPEYRKKLAAAGRVKALAQYNLARNADILAQVFRGYRL